MKRLIEDFFPKSNKRVITTWIDNDDILQVPKKQNILDSKNTHSLFDIKLYIDKQLSYTE